MELCLKEGGVLPFHILLVATQPAEEIAGEHCVYAATQKIERNILVPAPLSSSSDSLSRLLILSRILMRQKEHPRR